MFCSLGLSQYGAVDAFFACSVGGVVNIFTIWSTGRDVTGLVGHDDGVDGSFVSDESFECCRMGLIKESFG